VLCKSVKAKDCGLQADRISRRPTGSAPAPIGNQARLRKVQPKLPISQPGDPAEVEADRVAGQVMRMPDSGPSLAAGSGGSESAIQRKCDKCEEEEKIQKKADSSTEDDSAGGRDLVDQELRSTGQPLDPAARAFLEPRFGRDFGDVRVHADSAASSSARAVNALAYTLGSDIVFRSGAYAPNTDTGRRLLAHELTHVVQQSGPGQAPAAGSSGAATVHRFLPPTIMRDPPPGPQEPTGSTEGGPQVSTPPAPMDPVAPTAPTPKAAVLGTDSKGQPYVLYENEIRIGGTRPWRNNNPGNFNKAEDHPKNIGTDDGFCIFPDSATGMQELNDNVNAKSAIGSSIRSFITVHAPPNKNPTEKYITQVVGYLNFGSKIGCTIEKVANPVTDATQLSSLSSDGRNSFAMAIARVEGWCDVFEKKDSYNCKDKPPQGEYKKLLTCP